MTSCPTRSHVLPDLLTGLPVTTAAAAPVSGSVAVVRQFVAVRRPCRAEPRTTDATARRHFPRSLARFPSGGGGRGHRGRSGGGERGRGCIQLP